MLPFSLSIRAAIEFLAPVFTGALSMERPTQFFHGILFCCKVSLIFVIDHFCSATALSTGGAHIKESVHIVVVKYSHCEGIHLL